MQILVANEVRPLRLPVSRVGNQVPVARYLVLVSYSWVLVMAAYQNIVVLHPQNFVAHHQRAQEVTPTSMYVSSPVMPVTVPISPVMALQPRTQKSVNRRCSPEPSFTGCFTRKKIACMGKQFVWMLDSSDQDRCACNRLLFLF